MVEKTNACRILIRKPERKEPLGRPRRKWIVYRDRMRWYVAQDRAQWSALANTVMKLRVP
jgi:hypothetical protein